MDDPLDLKKRLADIENLARLASRNPTIAKEDRALYLLIAKIARGQVVLTNTTENV